MSSNHETLYSLTHPDPRDTQELPRVVTEEETGALQLAEHLRDATTLQTIPAVPESIVAAVDEVISQQQSTALGKEHFEDYQFPELPERPF